MSEANLGLVAGLCFMACITSILLEHHIVGGILGLIALGFAVALGLSKRTKRMSGTKSL